MKFTDFEELNVIEQETIHDPGFSDEEIKEKFLEYIDEHGLNKIEPFRRELPKLSNNSLCLCGSGRKYKKCCKEHVERYYSEKKARR